MDEYNFQFNMKNKSKNNINITVIGLSTGGALATIAFLTNPIYNKAVINVPFYASTFSTTGYFEIYIYIFYNLIKIIYKKDIDLEKCIT
jgi:cephalosporin-C deacetylase-like acetyl esterase